MIIDIGEGEKTNGEKDMTKKDGGAWVVLNEGGQDIFLMNGGDKQHTNKQLMFDDKNIIITID